MESNILQMNETIAEFIGTRKEIPLNSVTPRFAIWGKTYLNYQLDFHKDWNWLMAVAKKIYDYLQNIKRPNKNACCQLDLLEVDIICHIREIDLQETHKAIYYWIQHYNTQNQITNKSEGGGDVG